MLLVLVRSHYSFNGRSALDSNLGQLLILKHEVMHALFAEFANLPVLLIPSLLDLVLAALLELNHVGPNTKTVLVSLKILESLLLYYLLLLSLDLGLALLSLSLLSVELLLF
jgi:hypothetical protein